MEETSRKVFQIRGEQRVQELERPAARAGGQQEGLCVQLAPRAGGEGLHTGLRVRLSQCHRTWPSGLAGELTLHYKENQYSERYEVVKFSQNWWQPRIRARASQPKAFAVSCAGCRWARTHPHSGL